MRKKSEKDLAIDFCESLEMNESMMGEQAAFYVTCEQFEIDPDFGYELLLLVGDENEQK